MIASRYGVPTVFALLLAVFISPRSVQSTESPTPTAPGTIDEKLFNGMRWRQVGPFRGGRALAIEGVVGEPDTYYFGAVAGGVWKTTDGGANWTPLFDKAPISSIGALAVAPGETNGGRQVADCSAEIGDRPSKQRTGNSVAKTVRVSNAGKRSNVTTAPGSK